MASKWFSVKSPQSNPVSPFKGETRRYRVLLENAERAQIEAWVLVSVFPDGGVMSSVYAYAPRKGRLMPIPKEELDAVTVDLAHLMDRTPKSPYEGRYLDLKGAPWQIGVPPVQDGKPVTVAAASNGYEGGAVVAENLEDLTKKIDEFAITRFRSTPNLQESDLFVVPDKPSLSTYKDSMGVEWKFYELKDASRGTPGFYAKPMIFGDPRLIGPNQSITQTYRDVKDYAADKSSLALSEDRSSRITAPVFDETAEEDEWYQNPWVWAIGGGAALLLLGGVIKASMSRAEHSRPKLKTPVRMHDARMYSATRSVEPCPRCGTTLGGGHGRCNCYLKDRMLPTRKRMG